MLMLGHEPDEPNWPNSFLDSWVALVVLGATRNVGMATWFYSTFVGIREGDVYEPSRGCVLSALWTLDLHFILF